MIVTVFCDDDTCQFNDGGSCCKSILTLETHVERAYENGKQPIHNICKDYEEKEMSYTDNPVHDFNIYDAEQEEKLQALQKCDICEEPIQQEMAVCFYGKYICDDCLKKLRRVL